MMQFVRRKLIRRNNTFSYSDHDDHQKKEELQKQQKPEKRSGAGGKKVRRTVPLFPPLTRTASLPDDIDKAQHPFAITATPLQPAITTAGPTAAATAEQCDAPPVSEDDDATIRRTSGPLSAGSTPATIRRSIAATSYGSSYRSGGDPTTTAATRTAMVLSLSSGFGSGLFSSVGSEMTTPAVDLSLSGFGASGPAVADSALSLHHDDYGGSWSPLSTGGRHRGSLEVFKTPEFHPRPRWSTAPAIAAKRPPVSYSSCEETVCVTMVFEALHRGLQREFGAAIRKQMREVADEGMLAVWCDLRWSVPARYRCPEEEIRMKADWLSALRENGERVWDELGDHVVEEQQRMCDSTTEEHVVMNGRMTTSANSRRYDRLLSKMAHKQCLDEHDEWWPTAAGTPRTPIADGDPVIQWPTINGRNRRSEVTLIALNIICVKLQQQQKQQTPRSYGYDEYGYF